MNEDVLNTSVRRFLKTVGVTSQREIEKAVRDGGGERQAQGQRSAAGQDDADRRRHQSDPHHRRQHRAGIGDPHMRFFRWSILVLLALLAASPIALAQDRQDRPGRPDALGASQARRERQPHGAGVLRLLPPDAVSDKEITVGGRKIAYTATAGTLALFDQNGEQTAAVFYTAYVAKDARRRAPAAHLRVQRRPGRGLGLSQPRPRRSAHRRFRPGRPRRRRGQARRQSRHLARLHRSGDDRSDRHRLEPDGKARRRQELLGRAQRRQRARQGDRALRRQEQPRRIAEISAGRKLRRLPRRQGRARVAERPGHRRHRHRHGVAAARSLVPMGRLAICAGRRAAISDAGGDRARTDEEIHAGGAGRGRALRDERIPDDAGRAGRRPATRPRRSTDASPR